MQIKVEPRVFFLWRFITSPEVYLNYCSDPKEVTNRQFIFNPIKHQWKEREDSFNGTFSPFTIDSLEPCDHFRVKWKVFSPCTLSIYKFPEQECLIWDAMFLSGLPLDLKEIQNLPNIEEKIPNIKEYNNAIKN